MSSTVRRDGSDRLKLLLWYWGRRGGGAQFALGLAYALCARSDVALDASFSRFVETERELRRILPKAGFLPTYRSAAELPATVWRLPVAIADLVARARRSDAVLCAMPHLWQPPALLALTRVGVPFIPVIHDAAAHLGESRLVWFWQHLGAFSRAAAIIALSQHVAETLRKRAVSAPIHVMSLPPVFAASPLREHLPLRHDGVARVRFLFFGRFLPYKGLDLLRDAFQLVQAATNRATLQVAGHGALDRCAPGLRHLPGVVVEERWIAEDEIPALISGADVVVLPYREASQSGVVPQATALGKPVIVTPVGGLPEQIPPEAGLITKGVDATSLADAMLAMLDPALFDRLTAGARRYAEADPWARFADELLGIVRSVVGDRAHSGRRACPNTASVAG